MVTKKHDKKIVLFDGICVFCNRSVQFVIKHDPHEKFVFATLQSNVGQQLVKDYALSSHLETMVLIENDSVFTESDAVFRIVREMSGLWSLLAIFHKLPKSFRDYCYQMFGKNRYRLFGKKEVCEVPSPDIQKRFL